MRPSMRFSALQRAEIAEILDLSDNLKRAVDCFSALQRAEIAEIAHLPPDAPLDRHGFSALQRAEIAEIQIRPFRRFASRRVFQCSSTSRNC